jgi:Kef-type K+ transport system membrane component KefB
MNNEIAIIVTLSVIIFVSPLLSKIIKIPNIPIEIFLGSVAISSGFITQNHIFDLVAELGFLYLMFLAGLEVDLKKLLKVPTNIIQKGLLYSIFLYVFSILFSWVFELSKIFIVTLPLISIGLLAALKKEHGQTKWIKLSFTIGLIGEIISIIVLATVSAGLKYGLTREFYESIFLLFAVFMLMVALYYIVHNLIWWYPELKKYIMPKHSIQEQDIRFAMSIFFVMIAIMLYLHLEVVIGAFIAGMFIKTFFEHNEELSRKLEYFGFGWLVPIFFIWIGTSFKLSSLFLPNLIFVSLIITFGMILIRVFSAFLFKNILGYTQSILMALSHSMPLTLLIAVATLAHKNHSISNFYYYSFILSAIFEVIIAMLLINILQNKKIKKNEV